MRASSFSNNLSKPRIVVLSLTMVLAACSASENTIPAPGVGGSAEGTGGSSITGSGGSSSTVANSGGAAATSGTSNVVGTESTGGSAATGGLAATGGKATGGMNGIGGKSAGGTTGTGGKATGGAVATGGTKATGGAKATGGSTSAGGATSTTAPTWSQLFTSYFAAGTPGNCVNCHGPTGPNNARNQASFSDAATMCTALKNAGYIMNGSSSLDTLLKWFSKGGGMPENNNLTPANAVADINAWKAAGSVCP